MWPLSAKLGFGATGVFLSTVGIALLNVYGNPVNAINLQTTGGLLLLGTVTIITVIGASVAELFKPRVV